MPTTFEEAEKTYRDLKAQHDAGKLSDTAFEAEVGKLRMQDAQGRWWQIGVQSGEWYMHDGKHWNKANLPTATSVIIQKPLTREELPAIIEKAAREKWTTLSLPSRRLIDLPDGIGGLTNLQSIDLTFNELTVLPKSITNLTNLRSLRLIGNKLTTLPDDIGNLTNLQELHVRENRLVTLPISFSLLDKLQVLDLDGNPLDPALQSTYRQGLSALRAYLRSLKNPEVLYEAKLVFVGEGGVGKTTLLKAMTGQEPREGEPTTHGVKINVQAMRLPHPEKQDVEIQLNAWDFGGQEVYRVTHQFFFSRRSIYLLVWEPRKGVQASQVEDWLKLIRLRVGDDARVIIVSTHCKTGGRIARIDKPVLMRDFGSMIVGFHDVDSLVDDPATGEKVGIAKLKTMIAGSAKNLEQMGMPFNHYWRVARDELLAMKEPCIPYATFGNVCTRSSLDNIATQTLAYLLHDLGYIVYYGDDERLKNDVVLQPGWLTKAIGFVLEDRKTQETDGILPDQRLKEVWWDHPCKN